MNTDIRIATSFKGHRKRKKLVRLIGPRAEVYLIDLWITVAMDCPDGVLVGWDEGDIADACDWPDDPKKLVDSLIEANLLAKDSDGNYVIHGWCEHQGWACKAKQRSESARKAANAKWGNTQSVNDASASKAQCGNDAEGNAPFLSLPNLSSPNLTSPKKTPPTPHQEIINLFHEILPEMAEVNLTEALKKKINARWKEHSNLEWWKWYFTTIRQCPFLMGQKKDWIASFTWLTGPQNMTKVLNGEYNNNQGRKQHSEDQAFMDGIERDW